MAAKHAIALGMNVEKLREDKFGTDVTFVCKGGSRVLAHRLILVASCPYFEKMLTIDMSEKNTVHIVFRTFRNTVIELIVKYLYTGQIQLLKESVVHPKFIRELISACHMFDLRDLLVSCWQEITRSHLNVTNFAFLWAVRVDFALTDLGYINEFAIENIEQISDYANLQDLNETQLCELIEYVCNKSPQAADDDCIQCIFTWKYFGGSEESAAMLLRKIDLGNVSDEALHYLLRRNRSDDKKITIESILSEEAIKRLPKRYKLCKNFIDVISKHSCEECNHGMNQNSFLKVNQSQQTFSSLQRLNTSLVKDCNAKIALNNIVSACELLKQSL